VEVVKTGVRQQHSALSLVTVANIIGFARTEIYSMHQAVRLAQLRQSLVQHGLDDTYCFAHHDSCLLIVRALLVAWRGGCGPLS
jgi:hypothetical protein